MKLIVALAFTAFIAVCFAEGQNECPEEYKRCPDPYSDYCFPPSWFCDGIPDCPGATDEQDCGPCNDGFLCADNKTCIRCDFQCDDWPDCPDYSDELDCTCGSTQEHCPSSNLCYNKCDKCDNFIWCQCPCCAEQQDCDCAAHGKVECRNHTCGRKCIYEWEKCDGFDDCQDGWDEQQNCTWKDSEYTCANGNYVAWDKICDHNNDCGDNSDEGEDCDKRRAALEAKLKSQQKWHKSNMPHLEMKDTKPSNTFTEHQQKELQKNLRNEEAACIKSCSRNGNSARKHPLAIAPWERNSDKRKEARRHK